MFVDSEVWPNYLIELSNRKTPLILLNGRITMKTLNRWKKLPNLSGNYLIYMTYVCLQVKGV